MTYEQLRVASPFWLAEFCISFGNGNVTIV